jgi:hypothetical protein
MDHHAATSSISVGSSGHDFKRRALDGLVRRKLAAAEHEVAIA